MSNVVVFDVGPQTLGLPSEHVKELVRAVRITPLAGAPVGVEGVIDVRGTIVPVYDLRARLSLPRRHLHPNEHVVICMAKERLLAIRADRVVEVRANVDLGALPTEVDPIVRGFAQLPEGLVVICDLEAALSVEDAAALDAALVGAAT